MLVVKNADKPTPTRTLTPSRYNMHATGDDGSLVVANTYSGACVVIGSQDREEALALLKPGSVVSADAANSTLEALSSVGLLVSSDIDEVRQVRYLQSHVTSRATEQHLIIFPTEQCNFRCIYCYETFEKGAMTEEVRTAVKRFVARRVKSLNLLAVDWFGGEPLVAFDIIADIMPEVSRLARENSCELHSHITTNAYLLSADIARQLLGWGVNSFQITIDGPREEHDKRRRLYAPRGESPCERRDLTQLAILPQQRDHACSEGTAGTFDRIMANVGSLLEQRGLFHVCLRTNYDLDSLPKMPAFIQALAQFVGHDPRVRVDFCPIWADPDRVPVSIPMGNQRQKTYASLLQLAHSRGLQTGVKDYFKPGGAVCYAARANSLVIRSDGSLNKCTVALEADYNQVGRLLPDGSVHIDIGKFTKWTNSGMEVDTVCQTCVVAPACQGNACPLERFENARRPCPPVKMFPVKLVPLIVENFADVASSSSAL